MIGEVVHWTVQDTYYSHEKQGPTAKISFRIEGQIKSFPDKEKLKEFIITKPLLYTMLKGLI